MTFKSALVLPSRVLERFGANRGLLLAGGVGYNMVLSLLPLASLAVVVLSHFFTPQQLQIFILPRLRVFFPGRNAVLTEAIVSFVDQRELVGAIGLGTFLLFGAIAFRMLEQAFSIIFDEPRRHRRHMLTSALLDLAFVALVGLGIVVLTAASAVFDVSVFADVVLELTAFFCLIMLLTMLYRFLPPGRVGTLRSISTATVVAVLWKPLELFLVWFFENLSLVNVLYGSFAAIIVVLLCFEAFAALLLLGAQLLAELETRAAER